MSKNEENNSHLIVKNNSIQNLNMKNHNKNKSSNFLTDSPSTLISVQLHSINSNKNSKNKDKENNTNQTRNKNDSLKDLNNIRIKLSKISSQYSANTPKQIAHIYNQLCNTKVDPGNIVVKKNLKLGNEDQRKNKKGNYTNLNGNNSKINDNNENKNKSNNILSNFENDLLQKRINYSSTLYKNLLLKNKNNSMSQRALSSANMLESKKRLQDSVHIKMNKLFNEDERKALATLFKSN